jgi:hypothetical protein
MSYFAIIGFSRAENTCGKILKSLLNVVKYLIVVFIVMDLISLIFRNQALQFSTLQELNDENICVLQVKK